jgi:cell division protease FtsH
VKIIIDEQYARAIQVLKDNAEGHSKLANLLLEREVIFSEDLEEIFGKRPWKKELVKNDKEQKEVVAEQKEDQNSDTENEIISA